MSYLNPEAETFFFKRQKEFLRRLGIRSPCVFDVGGNIGQSIEAYRDLFPDCSITTFEPLTDCFAALTRRFGKVPGIRLENLALAESAGKRPLYATRCRSASSLLAPDETVRRKSALGNYEYDVVEVTVETLDRYCEHPTREAIDILKIDVQGAELNVLRGAAGLLAKSRIRLLYMEVIFAENYQGQSDFTATVSFLSAHRYTLWDVRPFLFTRSGRLWAANTIFVSESSRTTLDNYPEEFTESAC